MKLRRNHLGKRGRGSGFMTRLIVITILFVLACVAGAWLFTRNVDFFNRPAESTATAKSVAERFYLPTGDKGELVHHSYYSLSYLEKHEQATWVAYELTKADLKVKNVPRERTYSPDYSVSSGSAFHRDYSNSGYTRGHLAPAGDMAFSEEAMHESFFMSNMTPQLRAFNNGIWRELEEQIRDWAYDKNHLYIVTGPILKNVSKRIGRNKVSIPKEFYKAVLHIRGDDAEVIAFRIPHEKSDLHLREYAVSVDDLEQELDFELFGELLDEGLEEKLEASIELSDWRFDKKRFQERVTKWNHQ